MEAKKSNLYSVTILLVCKILLNVKVTCFLPTHETSQNLMVAVFQFVKIFVCKELLLHMMFTSFMSFFLCHFKALISGCHGLTSKLFPH